MSTPLQFSIDRFWEVIPPLWGCIRGNLRTLAVQTGEITVEQFHILRHIRRGAGSASELAEIQQISRPAISQAIDILVDRGLVSRQQSAADRRYNELALTDAGNELLNTIFQKNRQWMLEKMAGLTDEENAAIVDTLDLLKVAFLEESPTPAR
jgi:DNA-binding MarR family transcriptional regulator